VIGHNTNVGNKIFERSDGQNYYVG